MDGKLKLNDEEKVSIEVFIDTCEKRQSNGRQDAIFNLSSPFSFYMAVLFLRLILWITAFLGRLVFLTN
jgi:hypothetical protein